MTLRFVTGRAGTGKTTLIEREIADALKQDPLGPAIVLLVPDQMSYSMEYSLSVNFGLNGMVRAQVSTFKRLAWRVLQETGGITRKEVDGFGYRMLVRSVLEENRDELKLFRQAANKRGFTEKIGDLMKEFSRYCLDRELLGKLLAELSAGHAPRTLQDKVSDLTLLLGKIEEKLGTAYVDSEGHLALLASQVQYSQLIRDAEIYVDGFESFTSREFEILTELMKYGKRVTVVLPMEAGVSGHADHELFFNPVRTALKLREIARLESVDVEGDIHLEETLRFRNDELRHFEKEFEKYPPSEWLSEGAVTLIEATDRRAEVHAVARHIRELVMNGERYKQISILYRQPEVYDELIETIFSQYEIPVFISRKKPMLHHPLIEFSRSILEVVTNGWTYEAVFRAIKTDLFFPHREGKQLWRERADRLENYVLANGIYGNRWYDEERWKVKRYRGLELHTTVQTDEELQLQKELHMIRDIVRDPLVQFEGRLKRARNGRDIAEALFLFMESLQIFDKIIDLRAEEERAGRLLSAAEHDQAWNSWINVLDQFVLMFGDKDMALKEATRILDEGLDTLEFTRIPPSLDQVTVTTIELASMMDIDVAFVIGVNDGVLPQRMDAEGILSDSDREWFTRSGIELAPSSKTKLMDESYMAYRAFTSAKDKLYITYPIADEEGKSLLPSLYIARIQLVVKGVPLQVAVTDPSELLNVTDEISYISHPRTTLPYVSMKVKEAPHRNELSPQWRAVLAYYEEDPLWSSVLHYITTSMKERNSTERLAPSLTEGLYGKSFVSSVSRVESYYSCPFQHFASYGLGLQERMEYTLEAPSIGDLFHAALKWISDEMNKSGKSWAELSKENCWSLAKSAMDAITPLFFNRILLSTSRYQYIRRKLTHILTRTMFALGKQATSSSFKPVAIEAAFGPGEPLPPLTIPLRRGNQMNLRGRIDRIDATEIDGKKYLRIVDYKSSAKQLDLTDVYYGISLQMLTYLDVAVEHAEEWIGFKADPAGVLYLHIHNPMIRTELEMTEAMIEQEMIKSYKMRGYLLDEPDVVMGMDANIGKTSAVIPAAFKTDGSFTKASKVLSTDDLHVVRKFVRHRHQLAGDGMLAGDTRVFPYKLKERMPCQFCSYQSVCQFDPTDPDQAYRQYDSMDAEQTLEKMREDVNDDGHTN